MENSPTLGDDLDARYEFIENLIAQGLQKRHVVNYIRDHDHELGWNITDRQVRNYFDTVMKRMAEGASQIDRRQYHVRSLKRLDYIYRVSLEAGDRRQALAAEREIIQLLHLDQPGAEMDWKQAAEAAGIDPEKALQRILEAHAELDRVEQQHE